MILGSLLLWQAPAMAGEVDILVEKLVKHGVLSRDDAREILKETKVEAEKERQETIAATKEALMTGEDAKIMIANALPSFITNTTFKGDLRLRYQYSDRDNGRKNRNRGRYRFRLGMETKVNDKVDVGFGIASGGDDPRSTNQTMGDSFSTPDIRLNLAYATYTPFDWLTLVGGKFKNPLWTPNGWLWDGDINPEGVSLSMNRKVGGVELFINNGFWILDEKSSSSRDPAMVVVQPGFNAKLGENAYVTGAVGYYNFINVKDSELDFSSETNTRNPDDTYKYDPDALVVSAELGTKNTGIDFIPYAAVYGDYVKAFDPDSKDTGYMGGVKFGHEKAKALGQWTLALYYQRLEKDAWLDILPDSDAYDGETNNKGFVAKLDVGLMKNVSLSSAWYQTERISGSSDDEDVVQVDLNFKF
jgi:hypothetical protein